MDKSRPLSVLFLFIIFMVIISLSRSDSIVTVLRGEVAKLEFPYPCDSNKVTVQRENKAPFYNSAEPGYLSLPLYQLNRFSVDNKNCSLWVEIRSVMTYDGAIYICQAHKNDVIELIQLRLNVDYPPGIVSCEPSDKHTVWDWVPLQCEASVGSLAGEIICHQDGRRLPLNDKPVESGDLLKQTIWVTKEHPVFCCSSIVDQPKDICECNDFAWDPSYIESVLYPCPFTTPTQGTTTSMTNHLEENITDYHFPKTVTPLNSTSNPNTVHFSPFVITITITITALLVASLVLVTLCLWCKCRSDSTGKKDKCTASGLRSKMRDRTSQKSEKELPLVDIQNKVSTSNTESTEKKDQYRETSELTSERDCAPKISDKGFVRNDIQNKAKIRPPLLRGKTFAGIQVISPEHNQLKHSGVYKRENIINEYRNIQKMNC